MAQHAHSTNAHTVNTAHCRRLEDNKIKRVVGRSVDV